MQSPPFPVFRARSTPKENGASMMLLSWAQQLSINACWKFCEPLRMARYTILFHQHFSIKRSPTPILVCQKMRETSSPSSIEEEQVPGSYTAYRHQ